jgi:hypothetical protein
MARNWLKNINKCRNDMCNCFVAILKYKYRKYHEITEIMLKVVLKTISLTLAQT